MTTNDEAPACPDELDSEYLAAALDRAGRAATTRETSKEQLHGGRTGAQVWRLSTGQERYVVKLVPHENWRGVGMGCPAGGEPRLWLSGLMSALPEELTWPVLDVALAKDGAYRVLMDDVGDGIRDRGKFTHDDTRALFRCMASMHASFYEDEALQRAPLPDVTGPVSVCVEPILHLTGRRESAEPWVQSFIDDFKVLPAFLPSFLEVLGPRRSDDYLRILEDDTWKVRLRSLPQTLLQGDPRRANVSFAGERVRLFDWEFAAKGPPGADLWGHCYLHYWGYPPDGIEAGDDCEHFLEAYRKDLRAALGRSVDDTALDEGWRLGWVKMVAMLGFLLVDPLIPDGGSKADRERATALSHRAIERTLDVLDGLG